MKASIDYCDPEIAVRFEALQKKLVPLWRSIETINQDEQTIVVVPSITTREAMMPGSVMQAFEERFLFLLLLLRQPWARLSTSPRRRFIRTSSTTISISCQA